MTKGNAVGLRGKTGAYGNRTGAGEIERVIFPDRIC